MFENHVYFSKVNLSNDNPMSVIKKQNLNSIVYLLSSSIMFFDLFNRGAMFMCNPKFIVNFW